MGAAADWQRGGGLCGTVIEKPARTLQRPDRRRGWRQRGKRLPIPARIVPHRRRAVKSGSRESEAQSMAKPKRATWWRMLYHQRAAVESVSDEDAGQGLKAAFRYFDGGDVRPEDLTPQAFTVFCVMRPYIDESIRNYEESASNGRKGAAKRWGDGAE